ncbi:MAG: hypothetical protein ACLTC8_01945 [Lachnospiraceae bacterium]
MRKQRKRFWLSRDYAVGKWTVIYLENIRREKCTRGSELEEIRKNTGTIPG